MAKLTPEMKEFIGNLKSCVVATADKNGMPNASFKGSLRVLDDEHLIFADIFSAKTRKNLQENPKKTGKFGLFWSKIVGKRRVTRRGLTSSLTIYLTVTKTRLRE